MDDYNVNVLSEAKNEYSSRLLNIMTPLVLLGIKSIFTEAVDLCEENNEDEKYLMTFQNFLSRVPKWNANIIKEETRRIVEDSKCPYLEDLLTCVHITQLKILTSIRVSNHQKKIEIDIPKLEDFVHNVYINFARKLYTNIYLFEKDVMPLTYQKNMREAEIICRECVLKVIRDSMPIEQILRAYMDESVHDEIVEETLEKQVTEDEAIDMLEEAKKNNENSEENTDAKINKVEKIDKDNETTISEPKLVSNNDIANEALKEVSDSIANDAAEKSIVEAVAAAAAMPKPSNDKENMASNAGPTELKLTVEAKPVISKSVPTTPVAARPITPVVARAITPISSPRNSISFSDNDNVLDMGTNKESTIHAPKTEKRLEEISRIANAKRKQEEEDDDYDGDEDFDDDGPLKIGGSNIKLDIMDIQDISSDLKINKNPILDDIEVLA
tara:strand:- start:3225 stop:4553 length:1329 start_codon:yes stop_codon:yes gene_type:complete